MKRDLHLIVTKEWFDKIVSGEKTIEYREIKQFWISRLFIKSQSPFLQYIPSSIFKDSPGRYLPRDFDRIIIRCGYGKKTIIKRWLGTGIFPRGDLGNFSQIGILLGDM